MAVNQTTTLFNNTIFNLTDNLTNSQDDQGMGIFELSNEFEMFLVVAILLIVLIALLGNIAILFSYFSVPKLRTNSNVFIVSLSISDLTHAIFIMPIEVKDILHPIWVLGVTFCELNHTLFLTAFSASMWSLFSVSCYKYLTVAFPFFAQRLTMKHSITSVTLLWMYSLISSSLPILGWRDYPTFIDGGCVFDFADTWFVFFYTCNFFLPSLLMLIMYSLIYAIAKKHAKEIHRVEETLYWNEGNTKRPKKNFKAARTIAKIFLVYLICWLPYTLLLMMYVTCNSCRTVSRYIHTFLLLLAYSNSAINPFLYATLCQDFRSVVKGAICGRKNSSKQTALTQQTELSRTKY